MQTRIAEKFRQQDQAGVVDSILRKCVHCGFCNATCPTYQLLGDELDGPRGRIYQMKQFFEGEPANAEMLKHLDRCLTCRSCETTCPSGVKYSHLLEIGKHAIEAELPRPATDRWRRRILVRFLDSGWLFELALSLGRALKPFLPGSLGRSVPAAQEPVTRVLTSHDRKVLMLTGCVQPALAPNTNVCAGNLLGRLGIEVVEPAERLCCGAAALHTSEGEYALLQMRRTIDSWWPHIEAGVEAIIASASGCGVNLRDFGRLLAGDPEYSEKAQKVSSLYRDLVEVVEAGIERLDSNRGKGRRVAVHTPCTLQHGLGLSGRVERILAAAGYQICRVEDAHLCCGSAGTYSMLQGALSSRLAVNKLKALNVDSPDFIVTANIGCQLQLASDSDTPVRHWIELL